MRASGAGLPSIDAMLRSPRLPLLGALACLIGLVLTGVLAYLVPIAQQRDSATLQGFRALNQPQVRPLFDDLAHLADPRPYALVGLVLIAVALVRRRFRVAGVILGLLLLTGFTTQTLKPLLASPRYDEWLGSGQIAAASWPSGHATAAMTLALCAVLAVPARARPTVAVIGALFAIGVSYSVLALGWHFPSDVLGGFLVAMTWTLLAVSGLVWLEQRRPTDRTVPAVLRRADTVGPFVLGSAAVALAALVWVSRPDDVGQFAADHSTFVLGAGGIAALAVTLVLALATGLRAA
jgi:membrane-associated phospholipid phosphatase